MALQTLNLPLGTLAIVCLFMTEKKAWQKVKNLAEFWTGTLDQYKRKSNATGCDRD